MNDREIQDRAVKAAEDLRAGKPSDDLSKVINDIDDAKSKMSPKEYNTFIKEMNKETAKDLPEVEIVDTEVQNGKHQLVVENDHNGIKSNLNSNESERLDGGLKHEKRGQVNVGVNERGEVESITDKYGNAYLKTNDGQWKHRSSYGGTDYEVRNVKVDAKGNYSWEHGNDRFNEKADGSMVVEHLYDGSRTVYDKPGRIVEAPAGDDRSRKFKYDDKDNLTEIDGRLGHWERASKNGKVEWRNTDTNAVWEGDFKVQSNGDLVFQSASGRSWRFTTGGKDVVERKRS